MGEIPESERLKKEPVFFWKFFKNLIFFTQIKGGGEGEKIKKIIKNNKDKKNKCNINNKKNKINIKYINPR